MAAPPPRDPRPHRRVRASVRAGLVWTVAAAGLNVVVWLIASASGAEFVVWPQPDVPDPVAIGPLVIVAATVFAGLVSGLVAGVLGKGIRSAPLWIVILGVLATLASLTAPLTQPDQLAGTARAALVLMHLITGCLVTFGLARGMWVDDRAIST